MIVVLGLARERTAGKQPGPGQGVSANLTGTLGTGALTVAVTAAITAGGYLFTELKGRSFGELSRDPAAVLNGVFYTGYYSNLVILTWQVAATAGLLTWFVLRRAGRSAGSSGGGHLLAGGLLSTAMLLDDFFLLHEEVYPKLGIPESALVGAYAVGMLAFGFHYRRRLGAGLLLVAGALFCWSFSLVLDFSLHMRAPFAVEDGAKATGVALWAVLMVRLAGTELLRLARGEQPARGERRQTGE